MVDSGSDAEGVTSIVTRAVAAPTSEAAAGDRESEGQGALPDMMDNKSAIALKVRRDSGAMLRIAELERRLPQLTNKNRISRAIDFETHGFWILRGFAQRGPN